MKSTKEKETNSADGLLDVYEDTWAAINAFEVVRVYLSAEVNARMDVLEERIAALERTTPRMMMSPKEMAAHLGQHPSTVYTRFKEMEPFVGPGKRYPITCMLSDGSTRKVDLAAYHDFCHYRRWLMDPKRAHLVPAYGEDLPEVDPDGKKRRKRA